MKLPSLEWIDVNPPTVEEAQTAIDRVTEGKVRRCIPCQTDDDDIVLARLLADWKRLRSPSPAAEET